MSPRSIGEGSAPSNAEANPSTDEPIGANDNADDEVKRLAGLTKLEYERERAKAAEHLNLRVTALDEAVEEHRPKKSQASEGGPMFPATKPFDRHVDGVELLDALDASFNRYLSLPDGAAEAMVLWTVFTHTFDAAFTSPRLAITSPTPECGKTTALSVLNELVSKPLPASNITPAVIFRVINKELPTLLIDEADTFFDQRSDLKGILNSGHTRSTAYVWRAEGDAHEPTRFSTWAPLAIAKIGGLYATLHSRSIVVPMQKRKPGEPIEKFRPDRVDALHLLARKTARWAKDNLAKLKTADPLVPEGLGDRAADNWRPLLAIADLAGGKWPARARKAASTLSGTREGEETSYRILALEDIREIFRSCGGDRMRSADLCAKMIVLEDRPWPKDMNGRKLTQHALSRLLKDFKIRPRGFRDGKATPRGYHLKDFEDAFARYLLEAATPQQVNEINDLEQNSSATSNENVADQIEAKSLKSLDCCGVADEDTGPPTEDILSAMEDKIPS